MKLLLTLAITIVISFISNAQKVHYVLKMAKPQTHYFEVEVKIEDWKEDKLTVKMPVWAPGSYLVREFARNVNEVKASNGKQSLSVEKVSKNAWEINTKGVKQLSITYEVYAFELSVRTSFLDLTHGFVSGSGVFMNVKGLQDKEGKLTIHPYKDFTKISTALEKAKESVAQDAETFVYKNYDELVDCPIEIGNQTVFHFDAAGVDHEVALYGVGNYNIDRMKVDMAKIVEAATKVVGVNPNKHYTFIIHNVVDGQGGLEHCNSTTLSVNRWTYEGSAYNDFLSLVAHEYFHLWNVKRIRPIELGPFNYDEENYTTLLWVMEGFTSYYDELLLVRAGYSKPEEYLSKLQSTINYVEGSIGSRVQSVAHASFDAWIKGYRPNENSSNTTMTYYSRGQMLAALLDAKIIANSKGKKCLDDLLKALYNEYYLGKKRGFTEAEFKTVLEAVANENLDDFFKKYVHGTEIPDFTQIFAKIGVSAQVKKTVTPSVGVSLGASGSNAIVKGIRAYSAAEDAGLSVNDEIIALNGFRTTYKELDEYFKTVEKDERLELLISRDQILKTIVITVSNYERFSLKLDYQGDSSKYSLRDYWLRKNNE